jgi:hypothetical protein
MDIKKKIFKDLLNEVLKDTERFFKNFPQEEADMAMDKIKFLHLGVMPLLRKNDELDLYEFTDRWAKKMNKACKIKSKCGCGWNGTFGFSLNQWCEEHQTQYPGHA